MCAGSCAANVLLAEDAASGCCAKVTGFSLAHAKPLDVAESPNVVKGTDIAHWSPERLIDAHNTKARRLPGAVWGREAALCLSLHVLQAFCLLPVLAHVKWRQVHIITHVIACLKLVLRHDFMVRLVL